MGNGRLTKTQIALIKAISAQSAAQPGNPVLTKKQLADLVQRSVKTVDAAVKDLRRQGIMEVIYQYDKNGAQLPNAYRIARQTKNGS